MSVYLDLTREFNAGRRRAILSSGQAVVLHRLAIMSKDGDWILREEEADLQHVLTVLEGRHARYRFGAPLDVRWMRGGWSAHLEFAHDRLRVRTDFVTRPPRLAADDITRLWDEPSGGDDTPYLDVRRLAEIKKTNREKDYVVIGELARRLADPREQLLYSRSARDILSLAERYPALLVELAVVRPVLAQAASGRASLEAALDAERRTMMAENERRLRGYLAAARAWQGAWPEIERAVSGLPLRQAHAIIARRAEELLPENPAAADGDGDEG